MQKPRTGAFILCFHFNSSASYICNLHATGIIHFITGTYLLAHS